MAYYFILVEVEPHISRFFVKDAIDVFASLFLRRAELAQRILIVDLSFPFDPGKASGLSSPKPPYSQGQCAKPCPPCHAEKCDKHDKRSKRQKRYKGGSHQSLQLWIFAPSLLLDPISSLP